MAKNDNKISLHPLKFKEAVADLLKIKPAAKPLKEKKKTPRFGKGDKAHSRPEPSRGSRARKVTGSSLGKFIPPR